MKQGIRFLAISSLYGPTRRERERTMVAGYDMCASPNANSSGRLLTGAAPLSCFREADRLSRSCLMIGGRSP